MTDKSFEQLQEQVMKLCAVVSDIQKDLTTLTHAVQDLGAIVRTQGTLLGAGKFPYPSDARPTVLGGGKTQ